jgi:branched-chain amino acid transport system permease protein
MLLVIVNGLALGALYASTALGYNVMYSTSKVLSLGTGQFAMVGCILGAWFILQQHLPMWVGFVGCLAVGAVFGWLSELIAVRRVLSQTGEHLWVLSTLALSIVVQQLIGLWWGTEARPFPRLFAVPFAGLLDQRYWLPILATAATTVGLAIFFRGTLLGKAFVAVSEDTLAAEARGIAADRIRALSYMLAGVLGALSGFAAGELTFANFSLGLMLSLNGFIALAVGGMGSSLGALVGGLLLGLMTAFTTHYLGAQYQQTVAVGLLILLLIVRPQGLFGRTVVRQV